MADGVRIKLEGAADFEKALDQLVAKVARKIVTQPIRKGTKTIAENAKARTPVRTGAMKKAITVRASKTKRRGEISFNVIFDTKRYSRLVSHSKAGRRFFYPAAIEYGTSRQAAKPFMRPAFDAQKAPALRTIMNDIRCGIEQQAGTAT